MKLDTETQKAFQALSGFIGHSQMTVLRQMCTNWEERYFFRLKMIAVAQMVEKMPKTYEQDGKGEDAVITLHYFTAGCDWYITERDLGSPEDALSQCFGLADLGYGPELGYISIPELLSVGAELDLYFKPRAIRELKCHA
jgi:hypothetical protein